MSKKDEREVLMMFRIRTFQGLRIVVEPATMVYNEKTRRDEKRKGKYVQFMSGKFNARTQEEVDAVHEYMENHQNEITEVDPKIIERDKRIKAKAEKIVDEEIAAEKEAKNNSERDGRVNERTNKDIAEADADVEDKEAKAAREKAYKDQKITDQATPREVKKAEKVAKKAEAKAMKTAKKAEAKSNKDQKKTDKASQEALEDHEEKSEQNADETRSKNTADEKKEMHKKDNPDLDAMSNIDLIKYAESHGVELSGSEKRNKESLIEAIESKLNDSPPNLDDESEE